MASETAKGASGGSSSSKERKIGMLLQAFNQNDNDDSVLNMLHRWKELQNIPLVKVSVTNISSGGDIMDIQHVYHSIPVFT